MLFDSYDEGDGNDKYYKCIAVGDYVLGHTGFSYCYFSDESTCNNALGTLSTGPVYQHCPKNKAI